MDNSRFWYNMVSLGKVMDVTKYVLIPQDVLLTRSVWTFEYDNDLSAYQSFTKKFE